MHYQLVAGIKPNSSARHSAAL